MDSINYQEENIIKILDNYINFQFKERLINDFKISEAHADGVIRSAAVADLYIEIKGSTECRLIGFDNKATLLEVILFLSPKNGWIGFNKIANIRSLIRKMRCYKKERHKGIYEGLSYFVYKKSSNRVSKNARKITDEQLELLIEIKNSTPEISAFEVYEKMKNRFKDLNVQRGTISHYLRAIDVDNFKKKVK
ncbi:MAG: hypothetical protein ABIP27_17370 [Flavobacterium circumlabens]|uniref:hypothetical protein n=1 Tax=Flavobacterium circumlabens TaxID=2133765 RepID=UPI0032647119